MAKLIPDHIDQNDPRRNGERLVFEWLSNDAVPGTVYYSLLQKNHRHKLIGEVDFLYVCDRGFLCIEVKGGQGIYCEDKTWHSINRKGEDNIIHNPFVQAKDCMYALKKYFGEVYGRQSQQANYLMGYAVIFPECKFTGSGNDLVTEVMYDASFDLSDFPKFLNSTFDYWEKQELERHGRTVRRLSVEQLKQANDLLRGDFHVVPSMHLEFQHVEQKMLELTEEQFDVLDIAVDNPRVIVQGGAGTGKSLLAMEMARKYAAKQKKVLYICYNHNMAEYARLSLDKTEYITVSTYHSLMKNLLHDDDIFTKSIVDISNEYLETSLETPEAYDAIILDEGQDLFYVEVLDVLNKLISSGMDSGSWVMFMDSNQNIFNEDSNYEMVLDYIKELYHPAILQLKTNCRNTEQIARRTSVLTSIPPEKYLKLTGPRVITRKYSGKEQFLKEFRKALMSMLSSGIFPEDIVVLSPLKLENSLLASQKTICNLSLIENNSINFSRKNCLNYFTVQSYKGLESKVALYIDSKGFESNENRMMNYVAMSRARIQLFLFYSDEFEEEYERMVDKGEELLI